MPSRSAEYLKDYVNYLEKRVSIITKSFNPVVPITKDRRPKPEEVKLRVLKNPRFLNYLDKIVSTTNKNDRDKKIQEALEILSEMGFDRSFTVIRTLGSVIDNLMPNLYTGVYMNERSVRDLKASMGHQQVLYLPSHRSYVDFCLMSYICFCYNLEIPCIAAGMDFHGMMGMGELLRKTGAFFMRRTFGDEFYWNIFKEYVHEIITFNDLGLEFFVEGTRSRTFKALYPKTGLLSMALEPYFMGEIHNLKIVPISISYEKPLEEQLFVYELLGIPKPKESTMGLLRAFATLKNNNYGRMFFDFGNPIDLNEFFGTKLDKFKYASEPAYVQNLGDEDLGLTVDLAHFVVRQQQRKIVITIFNLMALIYNEKVFTASAKNVTVAEMKERVLAIAELFDELGAIVSLNHNDLSQDMNAALKIHTNILDLTGSSNSCLKLIKSNTTSTRQTNEAKVKGHLLCAQVMDVAVPVFSLQIYCNPTVFWLAEPAFFVLCLRGRDELSQIELRDEVRKLRELFIYEFVMHSSFEASDFETTLSNLLRLQIIKQQSTNSYRLNEQSPHVSFLLSAISPFVNCYLNTASIINNDLRGKSFVDKEVFIIVQSQTEQEILRENYSVHPYALCLEAITTTLLSLCNKKCLIKEKRNSVNHYMVNDDKLHLLVNDLRIYNSKLAFEYKYFDTIISPKM